MTRKVVWIMTAIILASCGKKDYYTLSVDVMYGIFDKMTIGEDHSRIVIPVFSTNCSYPIGDSVFIVYTKYGDRLSPIDIQKNKYVNKGHYFLPGIVESKIGNDTICIIPVFSPIYVERFKRMGIKYKKGITPVLFLSVWSNEEGILFFDKIISISYKREEPILRK